MKRKPSLGVPKVARYRPSGLKETAVTPNVCSLSITSGISVDSCRLKISTLGVYPVSPTARKRPSLLIDKQVAAFILSRLVHVLESGESLQTVRLFVGVEGAYPRPVDSLKDATVLFRVSCAMGVEGAVERWLFCRIGCALGCALKKRWVYFRSSSSCTTTAAAPATYANIRPVGKLSNPVGELTVVPMMRRRESPDSKSDLDLFGERGPRE